MGRALRAEHGAIYKAQVGIKRLKVSQNDSLLPENVAVEKTAVEILNGAVMQVRRNDFDVTNRIQTTDRESVEREINRLFRLLYPGVAHAFMERAFADFAALYRGNYPGYQASDTGFHDVQNVMEVTLAMARLMDGYERSRRDSPPLDARLFQLGVLLALFHDVGYVKKTNDATVPSGAFYTASHVSRGAQFLREYLPRIGLA